MRVKFVESAPSAPLVIQGGWLQKMEDTPEANARDHSLMVLARHCVKAPWQENLGSKNVKRSDFSDHWPLQMVSSRPIAVLCNSSSTHAVRKKNACWRLRRRNCQPLDFNKGDWGSAKKAVFDKNTEFATQVVSVDSQDLREAAPPASSMSSMLSAALARRPRAVETWLHQVE